MISVRKGGGDIRGKEANEELKDLRVRVGVIFAYIYSYFRIDISIFPLAVD
jgi:hypothetical protein